MSKFYVLPVLLTAVFAGPAMADPGTERVTIVVETRDLDLADSHGQRRLQHRVRAAINDACRYDRRDLRAARRSTECREFARAGAEAQVRFAVAQARLNKARLAAMAKTPPA